MLFAMGYELIINIVCMKSNNQPGSHDPLYHPKIDMQRKLTSRTQFRESSRYDCLIEEDS